MELRHLRYFIAVAEELNFSRAAERLHVSQPPLSRQIRGLEAELNVKLLDRNTQRVRLTRAGHAVLVRARKLVRDAESLRAEAQPADLRRPVPHPKPGAHSRTVAAGKTSGSPPQEQ